MIYWADNLLSINALSQPIATLKIVQKNVRFIAACNGTTRLLTSFGRFLKAQAIRQRCKPVFSPIHQLRSISIDSLFILT